MQTSLPKILIIGSGLLGLGLNNLFRVNGFTTRITVRNQTTDKNLLIKAEKTNLKNKLIQHGGVICDTLDDYKRVISEYNPTHIIDTIPQPTQELVSYLLSIDNCFKFEFSSPASDFAKAFPDKCPIGSYPGDKFTLEKLVNQRGIEKQDALVTQIGFIPEIVTLDGKPVLSGLSLETMIMCNLLTGQYDSEISSDLHIALAKFDKSKGFTCTTINNIYRFLHDIITGLVVPQNIFGRTLAMHSSQVWPRSEICNALTNSNYKNSLPEFYGQKSQDKISNPVTTYINAFCNNPVYCVSHQDVVSAIQDSSKLFKDPTFRQQLIETAIAYAYSQGK